MAVLLQTGRPGETCIHTGCEQPPVKRGSQCSEHGCRKCGGIILADTEDWRAPLCFECWHEAGEPGEEPSC